MRPRPGDPGQSRGAGSHPATLRRPGRRDHANPQEYPRQYPRHARRAVPYLRRGGWDRRRQARCRRIGRAVAAVAARGAGLRFGELLRRHRLAAGLTQEALAERAGLIAELGQARRGLREAQLAAMAGVAPLEASTAGGVRHRLNRGGTGASTGSCTSSP